MQKRAQLTAFIIMGLFVLLAVALLVYTRKPAAEIARQRDFLAAADAAKANIESCLNIVGSDALTAIAFLGGHASLDEPHFASEKFQTNYLYINGTARAPSIADMEEELGGFVDERLANCTDFSKFPTLEFELGNITTTVTIAKNDVVFRLRWTVRMSQAEFSKEQDEFVAKISPMRLKLLQKGIEEIVSQTTAHPMFVDSLALLELGLNATFAAYNNDSVVYILKDEGSMLRDKNYFIMFATKIA